MLKEITSRSNAGITVTLLGHFGGSGKCEFARVIVESPEANFTIDEIPLDRASDIYNHPFFYANRNLTAGRL